MWDVDNQTPFAADHAWVRDREGAEVWIVAVKCTFTILPDGRTIVADEQPPVNKVPVFRDDPAQSSLEYDCDLYLTKPGTDVLVNGHAIAPRGKPVTQVDVGLKLASISKTVRVTGDRRWKAGAIGLGVTETEPFTALPVVYERAFGGRDPKSDPAKPKFEPTNPVGVGFAPEPGQLLPNIEETGLLSSVRKRAAGFGAIATHWQPRVRLAGTYDAAWQKERLPLVPKDYDDRFHMSAPADQQLKEHLRGGEPVELTHWTPGGVLKFALPRVALGFETIFFGGERVRHRAVLGTVILEPDFPRVSLVWHTRLECHPKVQKLDRTIVTRKEVLSAPA